MWLQTRASATSASAVVTALSVSQPDPDYKGLFELLNAKL